MEVDIKPRDCSQLLYVILVGQVDPVSIVADPNNNMVDQCKNNLIINTILETQSSFDIIFIQELPWSVIWFISSSTSCKEEVLVGVSHHPNLTTFSRLSSCASESPRVIVYINIHISSLCFSLWNDIINHRDLSCISFFNQRSIFFLINVYSDLSQSALKYLKNTEVNINNVLIMTGNFNIRDNFWDPNFPYHSTYKDTLQNYWFFSIRNL